MWGTAYTKWCKVGACFYKSKIPKSTVKPTYSKSMVAPKAERSCNLTKKNPSEMKRRDLLI